MAIVNGHRISATGKVVDLRSAGKRPEWYCRACKEKGDLGVFEAGSPCKFK